MIGDLAKGLVLAENASYKRCQARAAFHLDSEPIDFSQESPITNRNIVFSRGDITLRYNPSVLSYNKTTPYLLKNDLFPKGILRFNSYEDVIEQSKTNKRLAFIIKYGNIKKEHFDLAYEHVGMDLYFGIDVLKYTNDVKDKIEARTGVRPQGTVLFHPILNEGERARRKMFLENNGRRDTEV